MTCATRADPPVDTDDPSPEAGSHLPDAYVHPSASIEKGAVIGAGTRIWASTQVRTGATVGRACTIGRNVFIDRDVTVGDRVKVQNNASLYEGVCLEDGVFIGPHVVFTNDRVPRAITPDGRPKTPDDWALGRTLVRRGAAVGAGAVVVTGAVIGEWAMVGAGSIVTHDVPPFALVLGNPARVVGHVSAGGVRCESADAARRLSADETDR